MMDRCLLLLLAVSLCAGAQTPRVATSAAEPPMTLPEIGEYLSDPGVSAADIPLIMQAVERNGIDFLLDQQALVQILEAAKRGKRSEQVVASVILQVLRSCGDCRSRYFGPVSEDELLSLLRRKIPAHILVDEVGLRGTKGIAATQATVQKLAAAGAPPALIDLVVPDDVLEVPTPDAFVRLPLNRLDVYSRTGPGMLKLKLDVIGKVELLFVNNALFYRPLPNPDKKAPEGKATGQDSAFAAPAPSSASAFTLESATRFEDKGKMSALFENGKATAGKGAIVPTIEYAPNIAAGRSGFRIIIDERDKKQAHTYELRVSWPAVGAPKQ